MPMFNWWRHVNKRFINPRAVQGGKWPVLTHTGRSSGSEYQTPIGAISIEGGFVVFLVYGRNTDWAKNVLASGSGSLAKDGDRYELVHPRIVDVADVESELPANVTYPPGFMKVNELLRMDGTD